jgi:ABC-type spermidine/putrescine transport system permease subunit I
VRTALMSIVATAITLLLAFPIAWTIAKIARGRIEVVDVCDVPDSVLGSARRCARWAG